MKNLSKSTGNTEPRFLKGIRGQILTFDADPFFAEDSRDCYSYYEDGLIVIENGRIKDVGSYGKVAACHPMLTDIDVYKDCVILPGMIDCHTHYVQSSMIGSPGNTLLDWLNRYTFPTEARFRDNTFANEVAKMFFRQLLSHGTTTANVFSTTFAASVDAFFEESERYNTRMISGKVLQDRNLPDNLKDRDALESIDISESLLKHWHGRGRQLYAVVPRFAPTSTDRQLMLAGTLYQKYADDGVYMHTHLDEAEREIEWVKYLFPWAASYIDVYKHYGLVGERSVFAHCCVVARSEWNILSEHGCGVVHCPSSNLFLGDGMFDINSAKSVLHPCRVGMGTDVGGGTSFSILRQLNEAYKVAMLRDGGIDAMRAFYLATRGGAEVLHLDDTIGSIKPGMEADICVIDLHATEFSKWRIGFSDDLFERLFVMMTLAPDNANRATYVAGRKVYDRDRDLPFSYYADAAT